MFNYLLFFNDSDAHFLLFSLVLVYLYRNKRRGRPGIDKEERNEGEDENNGDDEAWDEAADDKTDEAEGQEDGRGGGGVENDKIEVGLLFHLQRQARTDAAKQTQATKTSATRTARAGGRSQGIWAEMGVSWGPLGCWTARGLAR